MLLSARVVITTESRSFLGITVTVIKFEKEHLAMICDFNFKPGALVLIINTVIEKALNRKMQPRYLGPLLMVLRNKGSMYIVCKLDSTLYHNPVAVYCGIPYFVQEYIELPDFEKYSDISVKRLHKMERSTAEDPEDPIVHSAGGNKELDLAGWQEAGDELDDNNAKHESDPFDTVA
jgi:hypothetical protein